MCKYPTSWGHIVVFPLTFVVFTKPIHFADMITHLIQKTSKFPAFVVHGHVGSSCVETVNYIFFPEKVGNVSKRV